MENSSRSCSHQREHPALGAIHRPEGGKVGDFLAGDLPLRLHGPLDLRRPTIVEDDPLPYDLSIQIPDHLADHTGFTGMHQYPWRWRDLEFRG